MPKSSEELAHLEWLGYVQPVGLVVSIPALLSAQAHVNRNVLPLHERFLSVLPRDNADEPVPEIRDFAQFTQTVLGWRATDLEPLVPGQAQYSSAEVVLPSYDETLRPTYVVRDPDASGDNEVPWLMLVKVLPSGTPLDQLDPTDDSHWHATAQFKFERLLQETKVPIGLLVNGPQIRLVYKPASESSGYLTFNVAEMVQVAGRPILAALHLLLSDERLFSLERKQRLPTLLADSRKYQNVVSTELAKQVLEALYELVRGFQAANDQVQGELLRDVLAKDPNHVYAGLLTVLMRLVFVLYAEDRGLLSNDPVYANFYSVIGLFNRLRADHGRYPDTMDQRYGAWAQLLTLFRLIYEGGSHGNLKIPARRGYLFDPARYRFLEGSAAATSATGFSAQSVPRVSDGVVQRVLAKLLVLDGERLSYRSLDVEQIGSVYETMMGFNLHVAEGRSIAIKPKAKKGVGAPVAINLDELLAAPTGDRAKRLKESTDQEVTGDAAKALKDATSIDQLLAALERKIAHEATPGVVPAGGMLLQPSDERRRTGSHYTPRALTEPIVRTTLRPILEQLQVRREEFQVGSSKLQVGDDARPNSQLGTCNSQLPPQPSPTPDQILSLKVCDPAMGSGAFLVEACRQLADELVKAWHHHRCVPPLPPDEDEVLHARRLIAQRCLYGVDKNPMAVDLAKLSLWLATLAKDHPFTFVDHSLKFGDSLVGLTKRQIVKFTWESSDEAPAEEPSGKKPKRAKSRTLDLFADPIERAVRGATGLRKRILDARDSLAYEYLQQQLDFADEQLSRARLVGDLAIAAFFSASKDAARKTRLEELSKQLTTYLGPGGKITDREPLTAAEETLKSGDHPIVPFHWHIEFPEVFDRDNPGFDAIVGNPPFAGVVSLGQSTHSQYTSFLRSSFSNTGGKCDLVAFFFRKCYELLCPGGVFGLIGTKTIRQGDTRESGLGELVTRCRAIICNAHARMTWPGQASVVVSTVHVAKHTYHGAIVLNGRPVKRISAYLVEGDTDCSPELIRADKDSVIAGLGNKPNGKWFVLGEADRNVIHTDAKLVKPYLGGSELNDLVAMSPPRWILDFQDMTESEAMQYSHAWNWIERHTSVDERRSRWWQFEHRAVRLHDMIRTLKLNEVIAVAEASDTFAFAFVPADWCFANTLVVFSCSATSFFCTLQSRVHETWCRLVSSSLKDDLRYVPADCFDTFPLPMNWREADMLDLRGRAYRTFRDESIERNNEGLTKTYNRFHDPDERSPDILKLRELHAAMDKAVLEAYGWHELAKTATCEFLLDYEDDEDDDQESSGRRRKKPWRYRWPDDFRDEVLARLLALNAERAAEERLRGDAAQPSAGKPKKSPSTRKPKPKPPAADQKELPGF